MKLFGRRFFRRLANSSFAPPIAFVARKFDDGFLITGFATGFGSIVFCGGIFSWGFLGIGNLEAVFSMPTARFKFWNDASMRWRFLNVSFFFKILILPPFLRGVISWIAPRLFKASSFSVIPKALNIFAESGDFIEAVDALESLRLSWLNCLKRLEEGLEDFEGTGGTPGIFTGMVPLLLLFWSFLFNSAINGLTPPLGIPFGGPIGVPIGLPLRPGGLLSFIGGLIGLLIPIIIGGACGACGAIGITSGLW